MKFKNLLVSEDNQLVLSDYGLSEGDAEVLDLNKSLYDVASDDELKQFIIDSSIDPQKIYIFCVKEDFGNNDQLLEDIPNIKVIGKAIKKAFKKLPNIYFFIYNTHLKNEDAINPSLESVEQTEIAADFVDNQEMHEEVPVEDLIQEVSNEEIPHEDEQVEVSNEDLPYQDEQVEVSNEDLPYQEEPVEVSNEDLPYQEDQYQTYETDYDPIAAAEEQHPDSFDDSVTNFVTNQPSDLEFVSNENEIAEETLAEAINETYPEYNDVQPEFVEEPTHVEAQPEFVEEPTYVEAQPEFVEENVQEEYVPVEESFHYESPDANELDQIVNDGIMEFDDDDSLRVREDIEMNNNIEAEPSEGAVLFDEREILADDQIPVNEYISDSIEEIASENFQTNEEPISEIDEKTLSFDDGETSLDMPKAFFDADKEDEISYEDYTEFANDYELNIHALKSIYDFIWRILVLNNYNLKLNDLLYIAVNNLDAFSIGQSDFVRQTANKAESLFDLILQLDIKLEFNNSLFYIYLAEFFKISGNKIVVNEKFLDTISIWVNKSSKEKFINQVEQFMNYSTIYNKKIVFSYFIELANYVKGRLPSISSDISLLDIHRLLNNKYKRVREENIFGFIINRVNQIFESNGVVIEMYLVKTPDNMFGIEINSDSLSDNDSWKSKLAILYKKLIENIQNYILLKGNNETEIFNIFVDIKDLRMYQDVANDRNVLAPETLIALNDKTSSNYLTIGDELNREPSIVPTQKQEVQYNYLTPNAYIENIERGINMERKFGQNNDNIVNKVHEEMAYPQTASLSNEPTNEIESLREKYASKFSISEFESSISKRIEEYERKIKSNISRIEAERKQLREKMEELKNI